jgi:CRISPR-associated endoribonuclease Cas6
MMLAAFVLPLKSQACPDPDGWRGLVYGWLKIDPELHTAQHNPFSLG